MKKVLAIMASLLLGIVLTSTAYAGGCHVGSRFYSNNFNTNTHSYGSQSSNLYNTGINNNVVINKVKQETVFIEPTRVIEFVEVPGFTIIEVQKVIVPQQINFNGHYGGLQNLNYLNFLNNYNVRGYR